MDKEFIEMEARSVIKRIWESREALWPRQLPSRVDMLDPRVAAHILEVQYEEHLSLGRFGDKGHQYEVAGFYDRQHEKILVSTSFPPEVVRFTGAHEIGHWIMHPYQSLHRDRPVFGLQDYEREPIEAEADYFAACFLMPRKLIRDAFEARFGKSPFKFDEQRAFMLNPDDPDALLRPEIGSRTRAVTLAGASSQQGHISLSKQFKVSIKTMAIRLEELELIQPY